MTQNTPASPGDPTLTVLAATETTPPGDAFLPAPSQLSYEDYSLFSYSEKWELIGEHDCDRDLTD